MGLLDGKTAIVSGAGPGLGRETALAFAREGASVVVAARTASVLDELVGDIEAKGGRAVAVPTDITDVDQCRRLVERTVEELGGIDVLVNNAFVPGRFTLFEDADLGDWRQTFEVNLFGPLQLSQQVIPTMKAAGGGSIVFVNSMVIRKLLPTQGGYASSKGGLLTAAQVLAKELGPYRIRVNSVHPGWILGPNVEAMFSYIERKQGRSRQEQYDEIAANIPLGAIPTAAEIAEAIVFFGSDLSSVVTGQSLDVNGGEVFH